MVKDSAKSAGKILTAGLLLCGTFFQATSQASSIDVYDIDPRHTAAAFEYSHWGLSRQRGQFNKAFGYIEFDQESGTARIQIEIDAHSISTGQEAFDETLRSANFFDTANFPRISFKSSRVRFDKERLMEVEGDLIIKDVSRPIVLKLGHFHCRFMMIYGTRACGANASARILRSDFNLGRFTPFVGDEIDLYITVEAIKRNSFQVDTPEFFQK